MWYSWCRRVAERFIQMALLSLLSGMHSERSIGEQHKHRVYVSVVVPFYSIQTTVVLQRAFKIVNRDC